MNETAIDSRTYKATSIPNGLIRIMLWREWIAFRRTKGITFILGGVMLAFFAIMPGQMNGMGYIFLGIQFGATALTFTGPKALPLLYLAPIHLAQFWYRRIAILFPQALVLVFIFIGIQHLFHRQLSMIDEIDGIAMLACGLCYMSFLVFCMPSIHFRSNSKKKKRRTIGYSIIGVASWLVPLGIAALNDKKPFDGLVIDLGLAICVLLFGPRFLNEKKSLQYPLRS